MTPALRSAVVWAVFIHCGEAKSQSGFVHEAQLLKTKQRWNSNHSPFQPPHESSFIIRFCPQSTTMEQKGEAKLQPPSQPAHETSFVIRFCPWSTTSEEIGEVKYKPLFQPSCESSFIIRFCVRSTTVEKKGEVILQPFFQPSCESSFIIKLCPWSTSPKEKKKERKKEKWNQPLFQPAHESSFIIRHSLACAANPRESQQQQQQPSLRARRQQGWQLQPFLAMTMTMRMLTCLWARKLQNQPRRKQRYGLWLQQFIPGEIFLVCLRALFCFVCLKKFDLVKGCVCRLIGHTEREKQRKRERGRENDCVCLCACMCSCIHVCVWERQREIDRQTEGERQRVFMCVFLHMCGREMENVCLYNVTIVCAFL